MEHLIFKAVTTAADEGTFEAVISTATIDRDGDIVEPSAIVKALGKWAALGKLMPLAYSHRDPKTGQAVVVGHIDPASARVQGKEVVAKGWVDQATERGAETWRLVKSGTLSFSYGYLVPDGGATKRAGKQTGYHITELDLFEVSVVPVAPANNETRVLGWKADVPMEQLLNAMLGMAQKFIDQEDDADDIAAMQDVADRLKTLGAAEAAEPDDSAEDTSKALRRRADAVALEVVSAGENRREAPSSEPKPEHAILHVTHEEMAGLAEGQLKAVWSAAFINDLPDSAFLYIESGGDRDADGKTTPRSLRHFPYKDDSGAVDLAHLRNALARIPQSNLSQTVKDQLTAKAQRILDAQKSVDVTDKEHKARSVDPLRQLADAVALEYASDGESRRKPPREKGTPKPVPQLELDELRRRTRDETLIALSGVEDHE